MNHLLDFEYREADHWQVTGVSGFVGSHVVSELLREGYIVRGYAHIHHSYLAEPLRSVLPHVGIFSAVRGHNVALTRATSPSAINLIPWSSRT